MELKSKQRRYRCKRCGQTLTYPLPRAHPSIRYTSHMNWLPSVVTCQFMAVHRKPSSRLHFGRAHLLPPAADEGGQQWRRVHEHLVQAGRVLSAQVESDPAFEPSSDGSPERLDTDVSSRRM